MNLCTDTTLRAMGVVTFASLLSACSIPTTVESPGDLRKETIFAVTEQLSLIKFNAGQPRVILSNRPLQGLPSGEKLLGIDFRVARGVLYTLTASGRLYTIDTATGTVKAVADAPAALQLTGTSFGFDFNPTVDRIRVVSDSGLNLRLHPDTGSVVDGNAAEPGLQGDPALAFAKGDVNLARSPAVVSAAYTYNKKDEKLTTNYAIDRQLGALVMQGSKEGATPVVHPNTGLLTTVGSLGLGKLRDASFDIADVSGVAFAAIRTDAVPAVRLYGINLETGYAQAIGTVGAGEPLVGIAIEP
jgi:hypothetical protein